MNHVIFALPVVPLLVLTLSLLVSSLRDGGDDR